MTTLKLDDPALLRCDAYIDGVWSSAVSGERFDVLDPATAEVIARVADLDESDTRRAIKAAERAMPAWRKRTAKDRATVLRRWFELIMAAQEDLARLMTAEQGKPLLNLAVKSPTAQASSSGSPRKVSASMAT